MLDLLPLRRSRQYMRLRIGRCVSHMWTRWVKPSHEYMSPWPDAKRYIEPLLDRSGHRGNFEACQNYPENPFIKCLSPRLRGGIVIALYYALYMASLTPLYRRPAQCCSHSHVNVAGSLFDMSSTL